MKKFGYRKSRNGCLLCKQRRVKCDEQRPCGACAKHGVHCSLGGSLAVIERSRLKQDDNAAADATLSQHSSPGTYPGVQTPSSLASSSSVSTEARMPTWLQAPSKLGTHSAAGLDDVRLSMNFLQASSPDSTAGSETPESDRAALLDLELMHHYTLHAYNIFPHTPIAPSFYQRKVPRLALSHTFLLHQTLAIAGFHLLHVTPSLPPEYLDRATHHLTKASGGIRAALSSKLTSESSIALFAASSLLLPNTYASQRHLAPEGVIDDLVGMVALYRGISSIQSMAAREFSQDLFQEVFGKNEAARHTAVQPWISKYTAELNALKAQIAASPDLPGDVKQVATKGTQILLDAPCTVTFPEPAITTTVEIRILYRWSFWVADDFLRLVREKEPAFLAVLLFYCATMRKAEEKCWFLKGWAGRLAEAILQPLDGTPWLQHTQWAFDVIREDSRRT